MKHCSYQVVLPNHHVQCLLCPFCCKLGPSEIGRCHARQNDEGHLVDLNRDSILALALDPIEKKPLYHFLPGNKILSIGTFGCNLRCQWCQNHSLVASSPTVPSKNSESLIKHLIETTRDESAIGIAFTYNEPIIWFDTVLEIAKAFRDVNLKTVMVTNGYINPKPLQQLLTVIDGFNVDLKGHDEAFYGKWCDGSLLPVIETLKAIQGKAHLEVTTLLIEGLNTQDDHCHQLGKLLSDISPNIPLHLTRYFPAHLMTRPPTSYKTMVRAQSILQKYLHYVYIGNVSQANIDTHCVSCGELLIQRTLTPISSYLENGKCPKCHSPLLPFVDNRQ